MRKYFLFTVCVLSFLGATNAHSNEALFPDLAKIQAQKQEKETSANQPAKLFENEVNVNELIVNSNEDTFVEVETEKQPLKTQQPNTKNETKEETEEEEKEESGFFEIYPHDVEIVRPPIDESSQFCKATLSLENQTKYNLEGLQLSIQYGQVKVPYTFRSIAKKTTGNGSIFLMGKSCQYLTQTASIEVKACKAEKISDSKCKQLVKYNVR